MKLRGKIALVTGAGSGIGRAIAEMFAAEGARVVVNDLRLKSARQTAAAIKRGRPMAVAADVSNPDQVRRMFARVKRDVGGVDILVNNAGIAVSDPSQYDNYNRVADARLNEMLSGGPVKTPWDITVNMTDAQWRQMIDVHLSGTFFCSREAVRLMTADKRTGGAIVNMSSVAGLTGLDTVPHYSAAKAGILGLTRAMARELGAQDIRVNAICPGFIETPMTDPLTGAMREGITAQTPLGRWGTPDEIASTALFLASEDSAFCTGQWISPNGGLVMQ
jgi:3-oxoacyl-[acyl-carrier protein] reductase